MSALIPALIELLMSRMRKGGGGGGGAPPSRRSDSDKEEAAWNKAGYGADPPKPYTPLPMPEVPRYERRNWPQPKQ